MNDKKYNPSFNNHYGVSVGKLDTNPPYRKGGKKAFEWGFVATGSKEPVNVEVMLLNGNDGPYFEAQCGQFKRAWQSTDIAKLAKQVEADLMENAALISGIEWTDWFEVIVKGNNSNFTDSKYSALGADLHIQVNRLKRGVSPDGKVLTISDMGYTMSFPASQNMGERIDPTMGFKLEEGKMKSYIPATAANRAALDDILSRMELLRERLKDFLSQERIEQELASTFKLLPAPIAE